MTRTEGFGTISREKELELLMVADAYKNKTESMKDALRGFLYKYKECVKSPDNVRKILDKKIPKYENLSREIIEMRR